ncbi:MAG: hypothetical protein Q6351_004065 [Candidatus Njordarchaeum guaymaensis]
MGRYDFQFIYVLKRKIDLDTLVEVINNCVNSAIRFINEKFPNLILSILPDLELDLDDVLSIKMHLKIDIDPFSDLLKREKEIANMTTGVFWNEFKRRISD